MQTLTKIERKVLAEQAREELARKSYKHYLLHVHRGTYSHFRHTEYIAHALEDIANGQTRNLFIELPPRHGKSLTVSETFPSYYLGKNPDKRIIAISYSQALARKFGRLNRNKFGEFGVTLFDEKLSMTNASQTDWGLEGRNGGMIATGIGGSITGQGADVLIIDDPFKNAEEANSSTIRNKVWDEWESTLSTRLHKGASVIIIMTRWHEDDLIGRLLKRSSREWNRIRLPAIAEDDDLLGREPGEPLAPELGFDEKWAEEKKIEVGSRAWAALFQQRPSPAGGNIFKRHWIRYYGGPPDEEGKQHNLPAHMDKIAQSWDCTFKDSAKSDYVAGQVWARHGGNFYLLDRVKERMNLPETIKAIRNMTDKWPSARAKWIEDKANGPAVMQMLEGEISGLIPVEPAGGKEARANAVSPLFEAGNVYLPHPTIAPYVDEFVEELISFPMGENDDEVDACTQALNKLHSRKSNPVDRYKRIMHR